MKQQFLILGLSLIMSGVFAQNKNQYNEDWESLSKHNQCPNGLPMLKWMKLPLYLK